MRKRKYDETYMDNFKVMTDFVAVMENAEKLFKQLYDRVGELDQETSDMLHDLEFDTFYRTGGHRKARRIKEIRQERRAAKNTMEIIYPLKEFARANRNLRNSVKRMISDMEKIAKDQNSRVYAPRVLDDINIANKHFECNVIELKKEAIQ